jgi:hypothetical protein
MTGAHFKNYPTHNIVSVVDDLQTAVKIRSQLIDQGLRKTAVFIHSGERGMRIFDPDGTRHGQRARLFRRVQQALTEEEKRFQDEILAALQDGRFVVSAAVDGEQQRQVASATIREHSPRRIYWFGRWTTEELQPTVNPFEAALTLSSLRTRPLHFLGSEAADMQQRVDRFLSRLDADEASRQCWTALQDTLQHIAEQRVKEESLDASWLAEMLAAEVIDKHAIFEEFEMGLRETEAFARRFVEHLIDVLSTLETEQRQEFVRVVWNVPAPHESV